jgi:plastocyanin
MKALRAYLLSSSLCVCMSGCTDGAPGSTSGPANGVTTIDVSLTAFAPTSSALGTVAGYAPAQAVVPVGTQIRFVNTDSFAHTASNVGGQTFPAGSPFTATALTPSASGAALSTSGWSSGNLAAGASSPVFIADRPGTYLFGCFYHYGAPMRGAIVVQ